MSRAGQRLLSLVWGALSKISPGLVVFLLLGAGPSCSMNQSRGPSVLVITVDSLGRDAALCSETSTAVSGFQILCQDSVRFTHAFTTSPLSQPALASVLTGQLPMENGVWHNGDTDLSAHKETVAEVALKQGYRTAFFSGGPPIWSKSGLGQGFEVFDDYIDLRSPPLYRDAATNLSLLEHWLTHEVMGQAFFAVTYFADLQFEEIPTTDDFGGLRESSYEGQVKEVDESLGTFFRGLKAKGLWDKLNIVLVGLNGHADKFARAGSGGRNLNGENVQVALMIKPARKPRDEGLKWKIDANVSLADVGRTLYAFFSSEPAESKVPMVEIVSLRDVLSNPQVNWTRDRVIVTVTAWPEWHDMGGVRFGFRKDDFALLYDEPPRVFNTLTDRHEIISIPILDPMAAQLLNTATAILGPSGFVPWEPMSAAVVEKNRLGSQLWRKQTNIKDLLDSLQRLHKELPADKQVTGWLAEVVLNQKDWGRLLKLGRAAGRSDWVYVAQKNLGSRPSEKVQGCFSLLLAGESGLQAVNPRKCDDDVFLDLLSWYFEEKGNNKDLLREKFIRSFRLAKFREYVQRMNYTRGLVWDVNIAEPSGPSQTRLALALPEFSSYERISGQRTLGYD